MSRKNWGGAFSRRGLPRKKPCNVVFTRTGTFTLKECLVPTGVHWDVVVVRSGWSHDEPGYYCSLRQRRTLPFSVMGGTVLDDFVGAFINCSPPGAASFLFETRLRTPRVVSRPQNPSSLRGFKRNCRRRFGEPECRVCSGTCQTSKIFLHHLGSQKKTKSCPLTQLDHQPGQNPRLVARAFHSSTNPPTSPANQPFRLRRPLGEKTRKAPSLFRPKLIV